MNQNSADEALIEAMSKIGELIETNEGLKGKVEATGNQKQIDSWKGQMHGLKHALAAVSEVRNKYLQNEQKADD